MQTAFHITALVEQLKSELIGGKIVSTEFYKKERTAYFFIKNDKKTNALAFSYHPTGHGLYCVPASKIKLTTREKPWPIFRLEGAIIENIEQVGFDRIFKIELSSNNKKSFLICEGIGPNGNLWLLDENLYRNATLRKRDYIEKEVYSFLPPKNRINPADLTNESLAELFEKFPESQISWIIEKNLIGFNRSLSEEIVQRAGLKLLDVDELEPGNFVTLLDSFKSLCKLFQQAETGYLYNFNGNFEAYPFKLTSVDSQPEKFKTLSLAMMAMVNQRQTSVEKRDVRKDLMSAVKRQIKKLDRRVKKIEVDVGEATHFEKFKKIGELIQINLHDIKKGNDKIILEDIFVEPQIQIEIKLEPALTPAENAERYFKKHRKGREGLELLQRRLEISSSELINLQTMYSELDDNFENASMKYNQEIQSLLPKEAGTQLVPTAVRLPYKEYKLTTGATIFVGRDGSDNDRTTFDFAKPYELWFHAQQCPGSHVVLKFPNKSFVPSKLEIEETASVAAFYSKARKNSLVPVIYCERKYVRKPRKAKPGLVTVEREKSVMVPPAKPV